jgi:aspartate aminotransferase-like enzyme
VLRRIGQATAVCAGRNARPVIAVLPGVARIEGDAWLAGTGGALVFTEVEGENGAKGGVRGHRENRSCHPERFGLRKVLSMRASDDPGVCFRIASEDWEFQQVHRLNYQTFVDEIPQHPPNAEHALIDPFHDQNTYIIAVRGRRLVGMMAVRGRRPFSLDRKLPDLDHYLPAGRRPCEVRLLATTADSRHGFVFRGLVNLLVRHALGHGYDLAVISGTLRQARLYRHLGFVPFGPLVGTGEALYQPMYLTLEAFRQHGKAFAALTAPPRRSAERLNFLPGPVAVDPRVRAAFQRPAISHRSAAFMDDFQATRQAVCRLANADQVQILMGSGTLANDAIAAELTLWPSAGLILSNGAFGERLIDHASRFGLRFQTLRLAWGRAFDWPELQRRLDDEPSLGWVWAVHGETSTGVLNDLAMLKAVTAARGLRLCVDAVSSLGATPVDLAGVALASGVSGKGLGAFPGLAFVFQQSAPRPASRALPRYLDLGFYAEHGGVPFTVSSNLLHALQAALEGFEGERHFAEVTRLATRLREGLGRLHLKLLAEAAVFPAVTTIELPPGRDSAQLGQRLEDAGYLLHYRSEYLLARNWLQICLMGRHTPSMVDELLAAFRAALV